MPAVDGVSQSLDRATFQVYDQAERHMVESLQAKGFEEPAETGQSDDSSSSDQDAPNRLTRYSRKIRSKVRGQKAQVLRPVRKHQSTSGPPAAPILAPPPSKSMEDDRLYNDLPEHKGMQAKDLAHHPIDTVQSALHGQTGAKFAQVMDNQVIAHGANVGLVRAWDKKNAARDEDERDSAIKEIDDLKKERQDAYVRWTMDRHVLEVRQDPSRTIERPRRRDYEKVDENEKIKLQWRDYGKQLVRYYSEQFLDQHISDSPDLPPANEDAINTSIERLLMTSMQYQTVLMKIRHIYHWDDFNQTAMFCGAYILLVTLGYLGAGVIFFMLWLVIERWYNPSTPESIREEIKRSENREKTAQNLTQLIEQHGSRGWLDAAIDKMGPQLMLQLEDVADGLEIMRNFYEWRDPPRTAATLIMLGACGLVFIFTPLWLLVRGLQISAGIMFFGIYPLSSTCPQYRHLISPFKWTFWKISTDADWAMARIQEEARQTVEAIKKQKSCNFQSTNENGNGDGSHQDQDGKRNEEKDDKDNGREQLHVSRSHCTTKDEKNHLHHGHLTVSSISVTFETAVRSNTLWTLEWKDVSAISKARTEQGLCFVIGDDDGAKYEVDGLKERDVLFTQIIGYTGLRWAVSG